MIYNLKVTPKKKTDNLTMPKVTDSQRLAKPANLKGKIGKAIRFMEVYIRKLVIIMKNGTKQLVKIKIKSKNTTASLPKKKLADVMIIQSPPKKEETVKNMIIKHAVTLKTIKRKIKAITITSMIQNSIKIENIWVPKILNCRRKGNVLSKPNG